MTYLIGYANSFDNNMLTVAVSRRSNAIDLIPVQIPDHLDADDFLGRYVFIKGKFLSRAIGGHLALFVRAEDISIVAPHNLNSSEFHGTVCKQPIRRFTPKGREITELILAYNADGESNYIPCICWESLSDFASSLHIGSKVNVEGRIQSRVYNKNGIDKMAYELSVDHLSIV